ncbi:MAG: PKD domain-containing protein, partial [Flavobacteriales bacterium]
AIDISLNSGTSPFTFYLPELKVNSKKLNNLEKGDYYIEVSDSLGCWENDTFSVNEPDQLVIDSVDTTLASCGKEDGKLSLFVSGGVGNYTYDWSSGDMTATADSLPYGKYSVKVKDSNECKTSMNFTLLNKRTPTVSTSSRSEDCKGDCDGAVFASASGTSPPYTYIWDNGSFMGDTVENLCAGAYNLVVADKDSCLSREKSVTVQEGTSEPFITSFNIPSSGKIGDTLSFTANTISATSFLWEFGDGADSAEKNSEHVYDTLGTFNVIFTASNNSCSISKSGTISIGCESGDTLIQSINIPDTVDMGDTAVFSANTSLAASFLWEFGDGVDSAEKNSEHVYDTTGTFIVRFNASNG